MMKKMLVLIFILSLSSCSDKKSQFATFVVNYDYGGVLLTQEGNPQITTLYNSSYFTFDLGNYEIPKNLIPGDSITIEYTGDLYTLTSYPGQIVLNGELLDLEVNYTSIKEIEIENIVRNSFGGIETINSYSFYDEYVILDKDLNYIELSNYQGETLYGSYDPLRKQLGSNESNSYPLGALFSFNPR